MSQEEFSFTSAPGQKDGVIVLKTTGPLTLNTLFAFQNALGAMKPPVLILDLSDSRYMDSAGLALVMNQFVSAETGMRKFLLAGVSGRIQSLMEMTKVATILKLYPSVAAAEASV